MKKAVLASLTIAVGSLLAQGCTFHRSVPIRYTPLIQAERLVDPSGPRTIAVGAFEDARADANVGRERLNPISVHHIEFDLSGDLEGTVRNAFVDGLLKSGFEVPMQNATSDQPLATIKGKIAKYAVNTDTGWSKVTVRGEVGIELLASVGTNPERAFSFAGNKEIVGESVSYDAWTDILDQALQDCVKNALADPEFRALLKGARAAAMGAPAEKAAPSEAAPAEPSAAEPEAPSETTP
jgi:hypothetical protein